jgi:hypothetical protein
MQYNTNYIQLFIRGSVNRRTDKRIAEWKRTEKQTTVVKILHRKLIID